MCVCVWVCLGVWVYGYGGVVWVWVWVYNVSIQTYIFYNMLTHTTFKCCMLGLFSMQLLYIFLPSKMANLWFIPIKHYICTYIRMYIIILPGPILMHGQIIQHNMYDCMYYVYIFHELYIHLFTLHFVTLFSIHRPKK